MVVRMPEHLANALSCAKHVIARATPDAFELCRGMIVLLLGYAGEFYLQKCFDYCRAYFGA